MKFRFTVFLAIIFILSSLSAVSAQVDSAIAQVTNSQTESLAGGISGDGRFIVFESYGNIATENPRNADANLEVFLFDYAQRRIFQITDTKNLLVSTANSPTDNANIRVAILNTRPVISNDGKWLAFGSNATCNFPGTATINPISGSGNPGDFDPNARGLLATNAPGTCNRGTDMTPVNNLINDGNTEMWLYRIPDVAQVDLSLGAELPFTDLSGGTFVQATNTIASLTPEVGSSTSLPFIADDNRNAAINDDGGYVAFVSGRDLDPCPTTPAPNPTCGNAGTFNNNEIFLAVRTGSNPNFTITNKQITGTPRPTLQRPSNNDSPSISGNGLTIAFSSNENNPIRGMSGDENTDYSDEVFYAIVDSNGNLPTGGRKVQVTKTVPASPGNVVNIFDYGKRLSRDGRFIAFDSYADLEADGSPIQTSFAAYVYDINETGTTNAARFDRIGPRSDADTQATGGDLRHYPTFTDYTGLAPARIVLETRLNITSTGIVPTTAADGLNPNEARPAQVYSIPINTVINTENTNPPTAQTFTRLTKLPTPFQALTIIKPLTTDSLNRMTFSLSRTETGTGNFDLLNEVYYLLTPTTTRANAICCSQFYTGATRITVSQSPVPTPSPTATPTATPTPSPSATPTATPTPQSPSAVQGISPGMLAIVDVTTGFLGSIPTQTAVGSLQRSFTLPIQLSGVTMSLNGAAVGLKRVSSREITFVVPPGTTPSDTPYEFVINNNGRQFKGTIVIVPTRPDVFSFNEVPGPGGRARIFNATNRVLTREPFNVTTFKFRGSRRVPTVLRLYMTGIQGAQGGAAGNFDIRLGSVTIPRANISANGAILREPGVYSIDFTLPSELNMAGDVPVVVTITASGVIYYGRLDDTTSFVRIL